MNLNSVYTMHILVYTSISNSENSISKSRYILLLYCVFSLKTTRAQSQMKMLRRAQNEMFRFEIDSEIALVGCTLER